MPNEQFINGLSERLPDTPNELEQFIADRERKSSPLKPGTEARIMWHDEQKKEKTPFSIVYLHGFKGSCDSGAPVHQMVAQLTGCNLYLARLAEHGKKNDCPLKNLTLPSLIRSAAEAFQIGTKIGERVILMGTSLGGGLSLYLAGTQPYANSVAAVVLYSPLIHIYGRYSLLLEHAAGRRILQFVLGKDHVIRQSPNPLPAIHQIWNSSFHLNGALAIGEFVQQKMRGDLLQKVTCPVFAGYYYKNRLHYDRTVSVAAIKNMISRLGTPRSGIVLKNFPEANAHVICSILVSDTVKEVFRSTIHFLNDHLPISIPGN